MGRPIPLFAVVGYAMAFGGCTIIAMEVLRRKGPQALWGTWATTILFLAAFEFFAIRTESYVYYGDQPLRLFGWPTWWGPLNGLVVISSAVVITVARPYLRGWRVLTVVPLVPAMDTGAAWPVWTTNWSDVPWPVRELAGVLTFAISALLVGLLIAFAKQLGLSPGPGVLGIDCHELGARHGVLGKETTTR